MRKVQKVNFDCSIKLWIFFLDEKLVKMLWFWTSELLTTLISRENLSKKKTGWKTREKVGFFVKIEFLNKNLTFRIVWNSNHYWSISFWLADDAGTCGVSFKCDEGTDLDAAGDTHWVANNVWTSFVICPNDSVICGFETKGSTAFPDNVEINRVRFHCCNILTIWKGWMKKRSKLQELSLLEYD